MRELDVALIKKPASKNELELHPAKQPLPDQLSGKAQEHVEPSPFTVQGAVHPPGAVGFFGLLVMTFYLMGPPYGLEESIQAAGPLLAVLGFFILTPLLWALPVGLITAELGTVFRDAQSGHGGSNNWVSGAFGRYAATLHAFFNLVAAVADLGIAPLLMFDYMDQYSAIPSSIHYPLVFGVIFGFALVAYRGLKVTGHAEEVIFCMAMAPFVVLMLLAIPKMRIRNLTARPDSVAWDTYLQIVFFSCSFIQRQACIVNEVNDANNTFPQGMVTGVLLVCFCNGLIVLVTSAAADNTPTWVWETGYFSQAAGGIVGSWLEYSIVGGAVLSACGQYLTDLATTGYVALGMAEEGFLPPIFGKRSVHGTPSTCLAVMVVLAAACQALSYNTMVAVVNAFYCMTTVMEMAAFLKFRFEAPDRPRPFSVPLGKWGCLVICTGPCLVTLAIVWFSGWLVWTVSAVGIAVGCALTYQLYRREKGVAWHRAASAAAMDLNDSDGGSTPYDSLHNGRGGGKPQSRLSHLELPGSDPATPLGRFNISSPFRLHSLRSSPIVSPPPAKLSGLQAQTDVAFV